MRVLSAVFSALAQLFGALKIKGNDTADSEDSSSCTSTEADRADEGPLPGPEEEEESSSPALRATSPQD